MLRTAAARFWRGVREPWELLGRMRGNRTLWARYWRTVLVQAVVTLMAGAVVFWFGRQGLDAWNDAFGPDEPLPAVAQPATPVPASATAGGPATAPKPPSAGAPGAPRALATSGQTTGRTATPAPAPPGAGRPVPPPPIAAPPGETRGSTEAGAQAAPEKPGATAGSGDGPRADDDEDEESADESAADSEEEEQIAALKNVPPGEKWKRIAELIGAKVARAQKKAHAGKPDEGNPTTGKDDLDSELEKQIEALKTAPPEERQQRTAELVRAAIAQRQKQAGQSGKARTRSDDPSDVADERQEVTEKISEVAADADKLAAEPQSAADLRRAGRDLEGQLDEAENDAGRLARRGAPPLSDAERAQIGRARTALAAAEREGVKKEIEEVTLAAEALARKPPSAAESRKARRQLERRMSVVERDAGRLEQRGAKALTEGERAQIARANLAFAALRRNERGILGRLSAVLALLAAIYASLGIAQTGVLALSRDFHDALSRDLSLLVNVAPEDPPMRPKIRLDLPWVRRKANRRAQFFMGFLPGTALISVVGWLLHSHTFTTVLTALWAAYWWMVMTAGQSARAWSPPERTPRPWYLRGWFWLTDRFILFRWGVPRVWGRIWERMARRFYGPAERVEEQPLEFAGLALSRSLTLIPGVKLLLRPIFPVSAAHLLVEHAATARLPVPVTALEVADAAALAPDPEARAHSGTLGTAATARPARPLP